MSTTLDIREHMSHFSIFSQSAEIIQPHLPELTDFLGLALIKQSGKITSDDGTVKEIQLSYVINLASYWKIAGLMSEINPKDGSVVDQLFSYRNDDSLDDVVSAMTKGAQRLGELQVTEPKFAFLTIPLKRSRPKAAEELTAIVNDNFIGKFLGDDVMEGLNSDANSICNFADGSMFDSMISKFAESKSRLQRYNRKVTEIEGEERKRLAVINARIEHCGQQWASW